MAELLDRCKKNVRSLLLANKGGIPARQLFKEYQSLYEERIPYQELGFQTLGNYSFKAIFIFSSYLNVTRVLSLFFLC